MFVAWVQVALAAEVCTEWGEAGSSVVVEDIPALESSGIVAARAQEGVFYTHDDEDGAATLYVFELDGVYVGEQLIRGATNVDWEDIAGGPCPAGIHADACNWIGDIGDNDEVRDDIVVYVVAQTESSAEDPLACVFTYPEGKRYNAETLLVDPDGGIRIVTKESDKEAKVFRSESPACDGQAEVLELEAELELGSPITGGAMSEDGSMVVLRSASAAWMWNSCTLDWGDTPEDVDLGSQPQGEAITFADDGSLVTTSEGAPFRVWVTPCAARGEAPCKACGCGEGGAALLLVPLALLRRRRGSRT